MEEEKTVDPADGDPNVLRDGPSREEEEKEALDNPYFVSAEAATTKKPRKLPELLNHFNAKDLKVLFKSSIAVWILTIFLLIDPVLEAEGQALFFGSIVLFISPPSGIVFVQLLAGTTLLIGMLLGWAWGVITMKAALATRSQAETNARLQQLKQAASQNTTNTEQASGQDAYIATLIFEGFMLDTRISVTYFCMLCPFIYLVAHLRVAVPKLVLTQVFAIVSTDIFLTIAPLIPEFQGTLPQVLIKPAATAVAVGIACNILFFPKSTSKRVLEGMEEVISPMKGFLNACAVSFKHPTEPFNVAALKATKAKVVGSYQALQPSLGFLALDVSISRWNTQDITLLVEPLQKTLTMFVGILDLQISRANFLASEQKLLKYDEAFQHKEGAEELPKFGHYQLAQQLKFRSQRHHPDTGKLVRKSMHTLFGSSGPLLNTFGEALDAIVEALENVDNRRWFKRPSVTECQELCSKHSEILRRLIRDRAQFAELTAEHLLDPHSHLFDESGSLKRNVRGIPIQGLFLGLIFEERLLGLATSLETLLSQIVALEQERVKTRIWFPTGLRHAAAWVFGASGTPSLRPVGASLDEKESEGLQKMPSKQQKKKRNTRKKKKEEKSPDEDSAEFKLSSLSFHGGRERNTAGKVVSSLSRWLGDTEGLYAFRVVVVTIALGVPAVIPSSAGFYYRERGLWALIMAQLSLLPYSADFVYGLVLRVVGTVLGGLVGTVCWYIGSGNGNGNPYGFAVVMAVVIPFLMWGRLFGSPAMLQAVLAMASTLYLVVSYSWVDTHIPSYGNPGIGISVFWRRTLLVLIGFAAATIVTFVPRPPSAGRHYRRVLGDTLSQFSDLYALLAISWSKPPPDLLAVSVKHLLAISGTLASIKGPIQLLKLEYSRSDLDAETLSVVVGLCEIMTNSIGQMLEYAPSLPPDMKSRFVAWTGAFDARLMGDLMAVLALLEQSLKSSAPLPSLLPVPLHVRSAQVVQLQNPLAGGGATHREIAVNALHRSSVTQEGFRKYCLVLSGYVQFLVAADEMVMVIKNAVGETHVLDVELDVERDGEREALLEPSLDE